MGIEPATSSLARETLLFDWSPQRMSPLATYLTGRRLDVIHLACYRNDLNAA
jgi:hypothetical protein